MNIDQQQKFKNLLLKTGRIGMEGLLKYIDSTDFYIAPASTHFHGAYEGGLLEHSLEVYDNLEKMQDAYFVNANNASMIIVALLHDICKANFYKTDFRNVKNDIGVWEKVPYYTIEDQLPLGHGEKSVMLLQRFIRLTPDEIYAIRWHMGGFDDAARSYGGGVSLNGAMSKCKLLVLLCMADLAANYISGV
jgi:hypothetical protein